MAIPFLKVIQDMRKKQPSHVIRRNHLMLAGISQALFLKNWGEPESQILLRRLGSFSGRGALFLTVDSENEGDYSVWIYKNRDRVLYFARKRLIVHYKWSGFEGDLEREVSARATKLTPGLIVQTLALVA